MSENRKSSLSLDELNTTLEFAKGLYDGFSGYGFYSPFTQNQNLLALNNNGQKPTTDKLLKALDNAPYDYGALSSYSEFMEIWDTIYAKTLRYLRGLLAYDLSYTCKNIKDPSEYNSKEYKDDIKRVNKFLDNFDYKIEFDKVVQQMLRTETCFTWMRDTHEDLESPIAIGDEEGKIRKNEKFALQIMPQKQCMLTGYFNCSQLLYDFNINYFLNASVDINLYAPALKRKFKEMYDGKNNFYNPSAQLDYRNGEFANWVQCSPNDGAYAFKFDLSNFRQVPPFIGLLKSCLNNDIIDELQKDKDMISAYLLLAGEIKTMDTDKSGNKPDQFRIQPRTMGQFMQLVKSGLNDKVKPLALPLEEIKGWQFTDSNPSMAEKQYTTSSAQGVSATTMIYTTTKMSQSELENAIYADYCFMRPLYNQFNQFLNFYINKKTVKYKFEFCLDGLNRPWDRKQRQETLRNYADKGIVLDSTQWASAFGMKPQAFQRSLECAHNDTSFIGNLTMLLNANTMKQEEENNVGAPKKDSSERSDKTEEVEDYIE